MPCRIRILVPFVLMCVPFLFSCKPPERPTVVGPGAEGDADPVLFTNVFGVGDVEFDTENR